MLITAAEARSRISPEKDEIKEKVMADIEKHVEEAIKNDKPYFELEYELNSDVKEELEKKGYNVREVPAHDWDNNTIVSFGRNKK